MQVPSSFLTDTFEPRSVLETAVIVRKESGQRFRLSIPFQSACRYRSTSLAASSACVSASRYLNRLSVAAAIFSISLEAWASRTEIIWTKISFSGRSLTRSRATRDWVVWRKIFAVSLNGGGSSGKIVIGAGRFPHGSLMFKKYQTFDKRPLICRKLEHP